jgi:putative inorganic carbon (hco3(-)) transporter
MTYQILIIILLALFSLLAWKNLKIALTLLAGLLPLYLLRFSVGPVPLTVLEGFIFISFTIWLLKHNGLHADLRSLKNFLRPLLLLLAAASFAVVIAPDSIAALGLWKAYFIEPALVFIMLRSVFEKRNDWRNLFAALCASAIIVSVFAILQLETGLGIPVPWDIQLRITGFFDYPNALGLFLSPIVGLASVLFIKDKKRQWLYGATILLSGLTIVHAQTEAALIAIPAGLLVALFVSDTKQKTKHRIIIDAALVLGILILVFPVILQKVTLQDYSGQARIVQWQETGKLLAKNPAFGAGLGAYPEAITPFHEEGFYEIFQYPHNIILNIWSELGILGVIAFIWIAIVCWKYIRKHNNDPFALAAFAALAIMTIHGLVDVPYFKNDLAIMTWILIATLSASASKRKSATRSR